MSKQHKPHKPQQPARQPIDPILAKRLDQLNTRRPGSPLPPPPPPQAAGRPTASAATSSATTTADQQRRLAAVAARSQAARAGAAPAGAKRAKPAKGAKAASLALSVVTAAGLAAMFANSESNTDSVILTGGTVLPGTGATDATTATTAVVADDSGSDDDTATTAATVPATEAPTTVAAASGTILDGTYVGGASQNRWGVVQVQAVYSGGQLVDVQILAYPDGDNKSIRINQRALPTLIDESINAQSADINGVSGATYTSRSYVASLQSAIDAAKAASGIAG